jgi:hypothetical protein
VKRFSFTESAYYVYNEKVDAQKEHPNIGVYMATLESTVYPGVKIENAAEGAGLRHYGIYPKEYFGGVSITPDKVVVSEENVRERELSSGNHTLSNGLKVIVP